MGKRLWRLGGWSNQKTGNEGLIGKTGITEISVGGGEDCRCSYKQGLQEECFKRAVPVGDPGGRELTAVCICGGGPVHGEGKVNLHQKKFKEGRGV